jgi:la-related protein 1
MIKQVFSSIIRLPKKVHWRVVLDLADFAKRESRFTEAKMLFKLVSYLQPYAYQGWLEFAKMEEECGNQSLSWKILQVGLRFSPLNENLFVKAVKVLEKLKRYTEIRRLLAELCDIPLEKSWKILMEGALFEGRIGNREGARKAFKYLTEVCPTYGPIYLESSKYEEKESMIEQAVNITSDGLDNNPKYGPLWF